VRFVDSHLHLEGPGAEEQLSIARATGSLLVSCGVSRETSAIALKQAEAFPKVVKAFVGVHPSEVLKETSLAWMEQALARASGVGEIGLDPKYSDNGPGSAQMRAFLAQLEMAQAANKPVQVHSRDAERECLDALAGFDLCHVLMHWFQDEGLAGEVVDRGYFVSFGPSVLYSKKLQRMARRCPHGQVLTETDFPVPFGPLGGGLGPALLPSVVFKLSELWGDEFEDTRSILTGNALKFLGLSEKG
jgi:TatD DNase family protein